MPKYYKPTPQRDHGDQDGRHWRDQVWIDRDCHEIHLRCLTNQHLLNTIKLLDRQSEPNEDESDDWEPMSGDGYKHPLYYDLHREAALRGLMDMPDIERWRP